MNILILDTTTKSIKAKLSGSASIQPTFIVSWADNTGILFTEGSTEGTFNDTNDVVIVSSPAASTRRVIKSISIFNGNTSSVTITLLYDTGGTQRIITKTILAQDNTWTQDGTYDVNGALSQVILNINEYQVSGTTAKQTGTDGGSLNELSVTDDYMYVCVVPGVAGVAVWKRVLIFQT